MKTTRLVHTAFVAVAGLFVLATPAQAGEMRVELSAFVPTRCSAELVGGVVQLSDNSYSLGRLNEFCNTQFALTLQHGSAPAGAVLDFQNHAIIPGDGATVLAASAAPSNGSNAEITLSGVDGAQAQTFASNLTLNVSPIGL